MTDGEARAIVGLLAAAFPRDRLDPATVDVYALALAELGELPLARRAAERIIRRSERRLAEEAVRLRRHLARSAELGDGPAAHGREQAERRYAEISGRLGELEEGAA